MLHQQVGGVTEDVVLQGEPTQDEKDVAAPLGIVGGLKIKSDGDQILDVLDIGGLAVQMGDGCGFGGEGGAVVVRGVVVPSTQAGAEGGSLPLQVIDGRALRIEGGSGHADAFLSGGGGLQKVNLLLELLAALRVGGAQGGGFVFEGLGGGKRFIVERGGRGGRPAVVGGTSHGRSGQGRGGARRGCGGWEEKRRAQGDGWALGEGEGPRLVS
jgi:hypothetical protein